jgi:hypothetical protein
MLIWIAIVLFTLWMAGLMAGFTLHGFIHTLLVVAFIMLLIDLISDRKPVVWLAGTGANKSAGGSLSRSNALYETY